MLYIASGLSEPASGAKGRLNAAKGKTTAVSRDLVDALSLLAFWVLLFVGAGSVLARVAYYRSHGYRRPRLLTRDAIMLTGFALSFGLILAARVGVQQGWVTAQALRDSFAWGLATSLPAIVAVATFCWYELRVIERVDPATSLTQDHGYPNEPDIDTTLRDPRVPE